MLELAIVGGGLCGIAVASNIARRGGSFALFEARRRLGGRILGAACNGSGAAIDLGAAWFWPETQPLMAKLIADLGLESFPQHDDGSVLQLGDPDKPAERIEGRAIHNGAWRLHGGMASLIAGLIKDLPQDRIHLGHVLKNIRIDGDHLTLTFATDDLMIEIEAQRAVLAMPPRLLAQNVRFEPELDDAMGEAMRGTPTWMAAQAKAVIVYERVFWREKGQSGNAFVTHEQAVIGQIYDSCDGNAAHAALGGFLALSPELRETFGDGLPMLMASQMTQVFGPELEQGEQHYQDWAQEPWTCSTLDRELPITEHPGFANPLLRRALWEGKLFFGGSETAACDAGYLEGALEAARRIDRALSEAAATSARTLSAGDGKDDARAASPHGNSASLVAFGSWVATQGEVAFESYRQRLNRSLAMQQREQITQQALLSSIEEVFVKALEVLDALAFGMSGVAVERGRSALMPEIQEPFREFMRTLVDHAVAYNRTSCALSNFPHEHNLSRDYLQTILRDIAAAWQEFSLSANWLLLAKAGKM